MTKHLAIFKQPYLNLILQGKKTIESRFSISKIAPYNKIAKGDVVIMKESGGLVFGEFEVEGYRYIDSRNTNIIEYCSKYSKEICSFIDENFWETRKNKKYATLIFIKNVKKYKIPHKCTEKPNKSMASWSVLKD